MRANSADRRNKSGDTDLTELDAAIQHGQQESRKDDTSLMDDDGPKDTASRIEVDGSGTTGDEVEEQD